jgi:hypothetical protein
MGQRRYVSVVTNIRDEGPPPYLIPLSWDGSEVLSVEPRLLSGWAAYFSPEINEATAHVFLRFGPRSEPEGQPDEAGGDEQTPRLPEATPLEIREVRVVLASGASLRSSILRSVPQDRIEAAINIPRHREVLMQLIKPASVVADSLPSSVGAWLFPPPRQEMEKPDLRIEIPDGYRKPDEFYRLVGELFQQISAVSSRAAQEIAEANDVKPTTVHRWIREAKARGLLVLPTD